MSGLAPLTDDGLADRLAFEQLRERLPKGDLLLPYQQRPIDKLFAGTALLLVEKSRRIGLTWGLASYLVLRAASQLSAGGQNGWYMGYDKDMTLEFIETCAMWARAFGIVGGETGEEVLEYEEEDGKSASVQVFRIRFASGFKITALPSVPRAIRGKQGIIVIDEAAFHSKVDEVLKSAMAFLIWGGQVIVVSTHDGMANPFNRLVDEVRSGAGRRGEVMTITWDDALADGLYERVALVARTKGTELPDAAAWAAGIRASYGDDAAEELDVIPKAGAGSLIGIEDIIACEHDDCGKPELYAGGLSYLGRDVARRRDGQVQYLMELVGDVQWQRDTYEEYGQSFAHQDAFFDRMFETRHVVAAGVDQGGMGEPVVERAIGKHGDRVRGFLLVGPTRLAIATSLRRRFQERRIRIRRDPATRLDLMSIKKLGSEEAGTVRIVNDEAEVHADRFWAYGLASLVGDAPASMYAYAAVPRFGATATGGDGWRRPKGDDVALSPRGGFQRAGTW